MINFRKELKAQRKLKAEITDLRAKLRTVEGNLVVTEAWLVRFGGHTSGCAINKDRYVEGSHGHFSVMSNPHKCDCDWTKIEKEILES